MHFRTAGTESSATTLQQAYLQQLRESIETQEVEVGDHSLISAIQSGNAADISITQAATILACSTDLMDAEHVRYELLDRLIIALINAVLPVEAIVREIPGGRSAEELRACLEGEATMSLEEYCHIEAAIARRR